MMLEMVTWRSLGLIVGFFRAGLGLVFVLGVAFAGFSVTVGMFFQ